VLNYFAYLCGFSETLFVFQILILRLLKDVHQIATRNMGGNFYEWKYQKHNLYSQVKGETIKVVFKEYLQLNLITQTICV